MRKSNLSATFFKFFSFSALLFFNNQAACNQNALYAAIRTCVQFIYSLAFNGADKPYNVLRRDSGWDIMHQIVK
jgi:hypothetical protein